MKKRILTAAAALGMLLSSVIPVSAAERLPISGDANGDGVCDAQDANCLADYLTGTQSAISGDADMNADGRLDARDLTLLKRAVIPQTAVMMVYMSGSTLESDETLQCASADIAEMLAAANQPNLTVVILTGGAQQWHNEYAKADANYQIVIDKNGVTAAPYADTLLNMGDAETLGGFIKHTKEAYAADRYGLVLWGHGTGPLWGMCYDSLTKDTLTLPEFHTALETGGMQFDWIGLDCCLMGTAETLKAVQGYTGHLVASEIQSSKYGWKYDSFLTEWAKNPAMETGTLTRLIADEMVAGNAEDSGSVQIACYDVSNTDALLDAYYAFAAELLAALEADSAAYYDFSMLPDFSQANYDIFDLRAMAEHIQVQNVPLDSAARLTEEIDKTVSYNRIANMYAFGGIAVWYPRTSMEDGYHLVRECFAPIGMDEAYIAMMEEYCDPKTWVVVD